MILSNPRPQHPTTQSVVTGSRAIDATIYQNTRLVPLCVSVSVQLPLNATLACYADAASTPTTLIANLQNSNLAAVRSCVGFWVLPGHYYYVAGTGSAALILWVEWS